MHETHCTSRLAPLAISALSLLMSCASRPPLVDRPLFAEDDSAAVDLQDALERSGDHVGPTADDPWEVTLSGGGFNNEDFDAGTAQVNGSLGYFVSDELEVSLRQGGSLADPGPGQSAVYNGSSRLALDFHVPIDNVWPFFGASFGAFYGDSTEETLAAGPEAGVKVFVKDTTFAWLSAEYQFLFDSDDTIDNAFDNGLWVYNLGLGLRF